MNIEEWESLCDGCGKCCLLKIEDEETENIEFTNVACHLLDSDSCQCKDYSNRHQQVHDCVKLTPKNIEAIKWMPSTCSYKLILEKKDLPPWHHLITNDKNCIHKLGHSVQNKTVKETEDLDLEEYIVTWPK